MRRREFITLLGGTAAAWPLRASAQQPEMPVIGFVSSSNASPSGAIAHLLIAFRQGLNEGGHVEGRNVKIEYRWAGGQYDRLPGLLADLIRHQVSVIVASGGLPSALAAKAATDTVPILFIAPFDPVRVGLVTSLSHPGGNATGVSNETTELAQKRLELLRELVPKVTTIAMLVNPNARMTKIEIEHMERATRNLGLRLLVLEAGAQSDFEAAFATAVREGAGALSVSAEAFFTPRRAQIVAFAARHGLPTVYPFREYVEAGGLMSYGPTLTWAYQQIGFYASRILKGDKPSDLPVQMPTKFQLVINLKTLNALGLTLSRLLNYRADEIIE
jgi:putative tryptophan/tyrosine transport system substrate-binding protein